MTARRKPATHTTRMLAAAVSFLLLALPACRLNHQQSALESAGVQAERLESLWWLFFYITAGIYVIVMAVLLVAILRTRKVTEQATPDVEPDPRRERRAANVVKGLVAVTVIVLFALMVTSFRAGRAINDLQNSPEPLSLKITGNQWWWDVTYVDIVPANSVRTANELHLPAGRPVKVELTSTDVIHSFWLPNIHGKKDLVPNYPTTFYFRPDTVGTYTGQCAEFCGYQHAKMRFNVVVETEEQFEKWMATQRQTPSTPSDPLLRKGQQIFLTSTCTQCHAVQGTPANGQVGPNLTHVASRPFLAAGSLPNTDENLRSWITDPQKIKPGIRMPQNPFSDEDLSALVAYIESLK